MSLRNEDKQGTYRCGRCNTDIFFLLSEGKESSIPCPDCSWTGGEKKEKDVPSQIKIDLTQY